MEEDNKIENNIELEDQKVELEGKEDLNLEENQEGIDLDNGEEADFGEGEEFEDDEENLEIEDSKEIPDNEISIKNKSQENPEEEKEKEEVSHVTSSKDFGNKSEEKAKLSEEGSDILEESKEDEGEDDDLPPERKIRYRLFKFINNMRQHFHLDPYYLDLLSNNLAMLYANYLLTNPGNKEDLNQMAKTLNIKADFNVSYLESFIDSDSGKSGLSQMKKYMEYANEFFDVQATLVEFEEHSDNILSNDFNSVGIGIAINDMKVVVVNIFLKREVIINSCYINFDSGNVTIKGQLSNDQYGAYALRIISPKNPTKTIVYITPQQITPAKDGNKIRPFIAVFNNIGRVLEDLEPKNIEIYVRVKPDLIPYNRIFSDKIKFDDLTLGAVIPLMSFPNDKERKEERRQDKRDEKVEQEHLKLLAEYERKKDEEMKRRMKIDGYAYAQKDELDKIKEEPEEYSITSKEELSHKSSNKSHRDSKMSKSKEEISEDFNMSGNKSQNYEKDIKDLESTIEKLREDNESIQRKINILFEFRKKEGREERNFYKESNINESTYADSLSSTAGLYNDLNTHKMKLDQDLQRYQRSIEEQEKRKQDVYEVLMKYKEELLDNCQTRKGKKIPQAEIETWLGKEKMLEDELRSLRVESFKKSLEMNRLKKELKKMEDYFEGLHIIDFEQLKIENNTLTEKIEDRNEEIHRLKQKINETVQGLAHIEEKSRFISLENGFNKSKNDNLKKEIIHMKKKLTDKKEINDKKSLKQLNMNKKIDQINSSSLKSYYKNSAQHIMELAVQIDQVSKQLLQFRQKRKGTKRDITELLQRKERMLKEFYTLPKVE